MKLSELRAFARQQLDDEATPYLWSDAEINAHFVEAEQEASIRAKLLYDRSQTITLATGVPTYYPDPNYVFFLFDRFYLAGINNRNLEARTVDWMDSHHCGWEDAANGMPEYVLLDQTPRQLRVWPTPSSDFNGSIVRLRGFRLPFGMTNDNDEPEITEELHRYLTDWVLYRCYEMQDSDANNDAKARKHLSDFEMRFGVRPSAELQSLMYRRESMKPQPRMTFRLFGM